jgi:uncharacterized membrane protein YhaH (DUF805 family)
MSFTDAIKTCFRKYVTFSGRASRPEYWWFLPVGILFPTLIVVAAYAAIPAIHPLISISIAAVTLSPLVAVTSRRLRDTGERSQGLLIPLNALISLIALSCFWYLYHTWAVNGLALSDGPSGFGLMVFWLLGSFLFAAFAIRFFILGLITGTALFSQMAMPSDFDATSHNSSEVLK